MELDKLFNNFEALAAIARKDESQKKEVGRKLKDLLDHSDKTKKDLCESPLLGVNRTSVDRWLSGTSIPHPGQILALRSFFLHPVSVVVSGHYLVNALTDPRYRPVIEFFLKNNLDPGQLSDLLTVADTSKGILSEDMIRIVLGI